MTTPTSGTDASRPPLRPFIFSGLGGSMMNRPLSFFFFDLQIVQSSVLAESRGIAASTLLTFPEIHADAAESLFPVTDCPPCADRCDHVLSPDHLVGTFETTLTTPTSGTDASRPPLRPVVFSGLGGSMMNRPLSFFALQIVQPSVLAESGGIAASTLLTFPEIHADTAESLCPVTDCPPCADRCDHVPSPDHLIGTFETTLTTPTSGTDASRPPLRPSSSVGLVAA
ncbi:hypothetical protein ISCGN_026754 [Ixodes scapularis]